MTRVVSLVVAAKRAVPLTMALHALFLLLPFFAIEVSSFVSIGLQQPCECFHQSFHRHCLLTKKSKDDDSYLSDCNCSEFGIDIHVDHQCMCLDPWHYNGSQPNKCPNKRDLYAWITRKRGDYDGKYQPRIKDPTRSGTYRRLPWRCEWERCPRNQKERKELPGLARDCRILGILLAKLDRIRYRAKYVLTDEENCSGWEEIYHKADNDAPDGLVMRRIRKGD